MLVLLRFLPRRWYSFSAWKTWLSYVKWRMETYGVYYDGKFFWHNFWPMIKQMPSYIRWIKEMDRLKEKNL
jgi:hypothetical protein